MERLTPDDQVLLWPDRRWPQDVGALALLDGSALLDGAGGLRTADVRAAVAARLHLVPRLRQVLLVPRRGLGPPLWVDAPTVDLARHVRVAVVPPPGDEDALLAAVERLRATRLDRARPLWEVWLLPGLADGRVGMFVRMHHAMADGVAAVATLGVLLDGEPVRPAPPASWTPAPWPTPRALLLDALRRRVDDVGRSLGLVVRARSTVRAVRAALPATREVFAGGTAAATSLHRTVGDGRRTALLRADLTAAVDVAHRHGATVNDVLLSALAAGLGALLAARGEAATGGVVPVYVPVTLRRGAVDRERANRIGQMVVPLPVGDADPGARLERVAAATSDRKALPRPPLGLLSRHRVARRLLLRSLDRHPVDVTTADLVGPALPLHLAGAQVLEVFPLLPLISTVTIGVGALSYAGRLGLAVVADADAVPDLDVLVGAARRELDALTGPADADRGLSRPGASRAAPGT